MLGSVHDTKVSPCVQFGCRDLLVTEGALIGIAGAVLGAALGLAATAKFTGQVPVALCGVGVVAAPAGAAITAVSALLPARALRRLPAAHLLAED